MFNIIVPRLNKIEVLINRIYYFNGEKKGKLKILWFGAGKFKQKITIMILFLLTKNDLTYRYYINHTTSIRHQKVHLTYIENRPALA